MDAKRRVARQETSHKTGFDEGEKLSGKDGSVALLLVLAAADDD